MISRVVFPCLLAAATMAVGVGLLTSAVVLAHAKYQGSTPTNGATLNAAPASVSITYDDDLDPKATTVQIIGPSGSNVATGTKVGPSKTATVTMKDDAAGTYTVKWHAVADDDKGVTEGSFTFRVVAGTGAAKTAPSLPRAGGSGLAAGLLLFAGVLLAAGAALRRPLSQR